MPTSTTARPKASATTSPREITIAHSPDSDDAFMFYGLATNKVRVPGFKFTHTLTDIETLNHRAINEAFYDVTAISFHAYPYLQDNYTLMACGGSVGDGYGPMIVSTRKLTLDEIKTLFHGFAAETPLSARWRTLARKKLQELDVLADRIRTEYEVPVFFEQAALSTARWVQAGGRRPHRWARCSPAAPIQDLDAVPAVVETARRHQATPRQVALAWLLARSPAILPIAGTGSVAHLEDNIAAASLHLDPEEVATLTNSVRRPTTS